MARAREFDEEQVLDRILALFWRKGYEATSLRDLIEDSGLARQSLYNAFGDKHTVFLRVLERYRESQSEGLLACLRDQPVREAVGGILMSIARCPAQQRTMGCFVVNTAIELAPRDPEAAAVVRAQLKVLERAFVCAFEAARAAGQLDGEQEPGPLAHFCMGVIFGMQVAARAGAPPRQLENMANVALAALG